MIQIKLFSPKLEKGKGVGTTLIGKWGQFQIGVPRPSTLKTMVS